MAVDAAGCGNEARFKNDYRGVAGVEGECAVRQCLVREMGGGLRGSLGGGKKSKKSKDVMKKNDGGGIKQGDEILVSYGKGFWGERTTSS